MYQKLIIIGNLGRDPEMRYTADGKAVTSLSVATSRKYGDVDETTWFRISTWGKTAEACNQYLTKGSKVLIEGHLRPDPKTGSPAVYEKKDGTWGASYEVIAENVRFLSAKGETNGSADTDTDVEDIPF